MLYPKSVSPTLAPAHMSLFRVVQSVKNNALEQHCLCDRPLFLSVYAFCGAVFFFFFFSCGASRVVVWAVCQAELRATPSMASGTPLASCSIVTSLFVSDTVFYFQGFSVKVSLGGGIGFHGCSCHQVSSVLPGATFRLPRAKKPILDLLYKYCIFAHLPGVSS